MSVKKNIVKTILDFKSVICSGDEQIVLDNLLEKYNFGKNHLYTVIDGSLKNIFLRNGTYRLEKDTIYAFDKESFIFKNYEFDIETAANYYENPMIAVFNKSYFVETGIPYQYKFINPENKKLAIEAIIDIRYN